LHININELKKYIMENTFTPDQLNVITELVKFIQLKNLKIETEADFKFAFSSYLQSNATHYYFKADEFEKTQFANNVKKQLN